MFCLSVSPNACRRLTEVLGYPLHFAVLSQQFLLRLSYWHGTTEQNPYSLSFSTNRTVEHYQPRLILLVSATPVGRVSGGRCLCCCRLHWPCLWPFESSGRLQIGRWVGRQHTARWPVLPVCIPGVVREKLGTSSCASAAGNTRFSPLS